MKCKATFIDEQRDRMTMEGESAMAMLMQKKPYKGVTQLKQFPWLNPKYGRKNPSGGLLCQFTQSKEYKKKPDRWTSKKDILPSGIVSQTIPWYGWEEPQ